ncbi:ANTAR domain-containing response regulator [Phytohalomonas tamaricis]|uniref:ANTAR domain-containing response regulator n=1 Tax=Phytohalomonas tamaricis TaxID=2081032 RepID=UPI000D0BCA41|nr:ANTAR domain-containing protein [Phytohalomonas tamaricis]
MSTSYNAFKHGARLLLVDCDERTRMALNKSLDRLGIASLAVFDDAAPDLGETSALIVELDQFNSPRLLEAASARALSIIAVTRHETLSQIQRAIRLGATALLNKPITQSSVYTTLMMAGGLRERFTTLQRECDELARKVASRPLVAQAVARVMTQHSVGEEQAFTHLRTLAMQRNVCIEVICTETLHDQPGHIRTS